MKSVNTVKKVFNEKWTVYEITKNLWLEHFSDHVLLSYIENNAYAYSMYVDNEHDVENAIRDLLEIVKYSAVKSVKY